jgi:hypothetical protein
VTNLQVVVRPPSQPSWFPWPRRTIVVVVILLAFVVMLTVIGAPPLVAVGAVIATAVVAITGDVPVVAIPGL